MLLPQSETHSRAITIVQEVADREGVDFTDLPPLHDKIDPEALDALADSFTPQTRGQIQFTYCGYEILIDSDGHVIVGDRTNQEKQLSQPPINAVKED